MIEKIDQALLSLATKTAVKWEEVTGKGKEDLQKLLYFSSSLGFAASAVTSISNGEAALSAIVSMIRSTLALKKAILPPSSLLLNASSPLISVWTISLGSILLLSDLLRLPVADAQEALHLTSTLAFSSSLIVHEVGDYIGRVDSKWPPKKSKLKKLAENVKNLVWWSPQTIPTVNE